MRNLKQKLKELEATIINEREEKINRISKTKERDKQIHEQYIGKWNQNIINNDKFKSALDEILITFKKINPKPNNYLWMFLDDVSVKEKLKNQVSFYLNGHKIALKLNLLGVSTYLALYDNTKQIAQSKVDNLVKLREKFLSKILEVFKDQNK